MAPNSNRKIRDNIKDTSSSDVEPKNEDNPTNIAAKASLVGAIHGDDVRLPGLPRLLYQDNVVSMQSHRGRESPAGTPRKRSPTWERIAKDSVRSFVEADSLPLYNNRERERGGV